MAVCDESGENRSFQGPHFWLDDASAPQVDERGMHWVILVYREVESSPQALTCIIFLNACQVRTGLFVVAVAMGCYR